MSHNIYFEQTAIPPDAPVLGIWVRVPRILFASDEGLYDDLSISETKLVYVELTAEEWTRVYGNQGAIDALGQALGPEIAAALGGYVKGWHPSPQDDSPAGNREA
jgi:hypothetical protein